MCLQALGLAERGKRSVDCLPGSDVLCTCSSKSSADARLGFDILEAFDRRLRALVCIKRADLAGRMQKSEDRSSDGSRR
jgi:hypothetical protein